ncbi:2746_t:CDS:2, partial [Gigaspora margarita]
KTASNEIINLPTQDKVILYKEHPTTVIGIFFAKIELFSSTVIIEDDNYKDYVGQAKIKWNNNRSQPRIFCELMTN